MNISGSYPLVGLDRIEILTSYNPNRLFGFFGDMNDYYRFKVSIDYLKKIHSVDLGIPTTDVASAHVHIRMYDYIRLLPKNYGQLVIDTRYASGLECVKQIGIKDQLIKIFYKDLKHIRDDIIYFPETIRNRVLYVDPSIYFKSEHDYVAFKLTA